MAEDKDSDASTESDGTKERLDINKSNQSESDDETHETEIAAENQKIADECLNESRPPVKKSTSSPALCNASKSKFEGCHTLSDAYYER